MLRYLGAFDMNSTTAVPVTPALAVTVAVPAVIPEMRLMVKPHLNLEDYLLLVIVRMIIVYHLMVLS